MVWKYHYHPQKREPIKVYRGIKGVVGIKGRRTELQAILIHKHLNSERAKRYLKKLRRSSLFPTLPRI